MTERVVAVRGSLPPAPSGSCKMTCLSVGKRDASRMLAVDRRGKGNERTRSAGKSIELESRSNAAE